MFGQTGNKQGHEPSIDASGNRQQYQDSNTLAPQFQGNGTTNGSNGAHHSDVGPGPTFDAHQYARTNPNVLDPSNFDSHHGMSQPNAAGVGAHGRGMDQPSAGFDAGGKGGNMNQTGAGHPTGNLHTNADSYGDSRYPNPASVAPPPPPHDRGYEQNRNLGQSHIPQDHGNLNTAAPGAGIPPAAHDGRPTTYGTAGAGAHAPRDATGYGDAVHHPPPTHPAAAGGYPSTAAPQSGTKSSPSTQILVGKVEKAIGTVIRSDDLKNEGMAREADGKRMAQERHADRLDNEARMARDRAAQHGEYVGHSQFFSGGVVQPNERQA